MNKYNHYFHLVNPSPWPITSALSTMILLTGSVKFFQTKHFTLILLGMITTMIIMYQWWRDVTRESTYQGIHTNMVLIMMKWGMTLFIISEMFFFLSFFWSFYHSSLSPTIELGLIWPPLSILPFNPFQIPLLNTIILLSSGISITWAHHSMINKIYYQTSKAIIITIIMGIYFSFLQKMEYNDALFNISDSVYGSSFFMTTGLHGIHVLIGTLFIIICLLRHHMNHFSKEHHFGFEASAWYWHFVDIIWLFVFLSLYWWGS